MTTPAPPLSTVVRSARLDGIYVYRRDLIYVKGVFRALDEAPTGHALMLRWSAGNWGQYIVPAPAVAYCAIDAPDRTVLTLSPDGQVHVARPNGFAWERIDPGPDGPNSMRHMLDIRPVGGAVYASGMARMVYRREASGEWVRFDQGMRGRPDQPLVTGLRAIDGCAPDDLYAVGLGGEIWHYDGTRWGQADSPTNVRLDRVCCVTRERVYASGVNGTLLEGGPNRWDVVEHGETDRTFWGLASFRGVVYLADGVELFAFDGDRLDRVDTGTSGPPDVSYLHANDGVLAAVGERRVLLFDGERWTELAVPGIA